MTEIDEQRITELAQEPSHVLRGGAGAAVPDEARQVVEVLALMRPRAHEQDKQAGGS